MMVVEVGDLIRFSVALLKDIYEQPEHQTVLVTVTEIQTASDGSKTLVLERLQPTGENP